MCSITSSERITRNFRRSPVRASRPRSPHRLALYHHVLRIFISNSLFIIIFPDVLSVIPRVHLPVRLAC